MLSCWSLLSAVCFACLLVFVSFFETDWIFFSFFQTEWVFFSVIQPKWVFLLVLSNGVGRELLKLHTKRAKEDAADLSSFAGSPLHSSSALTCSCFCISAFPSSLFSSFFSTFYMPRLSFGRLFTLFPHTHRLRFGIQLCLRRMPDVCGFFQYGVSKCSSCMCVSAPSQYA